MKKIKVWKLFLILICSLLLFSTTIFAIGGPGIVSTPDPPAPTGLKITIVED